MPKARPKSRKRADEENAWNLRKLALFLEESPGFRLGLALYDVPETRERFLRELADAVANRPIHLTRLDLSRSAQEELLLRRLQAHLQANPAPEGKHPAVMVTGLEATIDFHTKGPLEIFVGGPLLGNANMQRDAFSRLCPVPIVIWLNSWGYRAFAHAAPDLWHWRTGIVEFTGPPGPKTNLITTPSDISDRLAPGAKGERIAMLRDLIRTLENAEDRETAGNKARRARLFLEVGRTHRLSSNLPEAILEYEEALNLFRTIGDRAGGGTALHDLAQTYEAMGQAKRAVSCGEQALAIAQELGDRRNEAAVLSNLGNAYGLLRQIKRAIPYYEQALAIDRHLGDRQGEVISLLGLGNAYAALRQVETAISYYEQALEIAREIRATRFEGAALGNLGTAYRNLGQLPRAADCYERYLAIAREIGDRFSEGVALSNLGDVLSQLGSIDQAIQSFEASREIAEEIHEPKLIDFASSRLAEMRGEAITTSEIMT
jgi:tetratricopeptide (TPR) repeat protein